MIHDLGFLARRDGVKVAISITAEDILNCNTVEIAEGLIETLARVLGLKKRDDGVDIKAPGAWIVSTLMCVLMTDV